MTHSITIHLRDDHYRQLDEASERRSQLPDALIEDIVVDYLRGGVEGLPFTQPPRAAVEAYDPALDPLARFIGIGVSDDPAWVKRHDEIIADEAMDPHEPPPYEDVERLAHELDLLDQLRLLEELAEVVRRDLTHLSASAVLRRLGYQGRLADANSTMPSDSDSAPE